MLTACLFFQEEEKARKAALEQQKQQQVGWNAQFLPCEEAFGEPLAYWGDGPAVPLLFLKRTGRDGLA